MNLDDIKIGEKVDQAEAVIHQELSGRFVALRRKGDAWWLLSDADANKVKAFQVQDHLHGRWVLALLKQV